MLKEKIEKICDFILLKTKFEYEETLKEKSLGRKILKIFLCSIFLIAYGIAAFNEWLWDRLNNSVKDVITRIGFGFLSLILLAGVLIPGFFVCYEIFDIVDNTAACITSKKYESEVIGSEHSHIFSGVLKGTSEEYVTVRFVENGETVVKEIDFRYASFIYTITQKFHNSDIEETEIVCHTPWSYIIRKTVLNSIMTDIFMFICCLLMVIMFGYCLKHTLPVVIKGSEYKEDPHHNSDTGRGKE